MLGEVGEGDGAVPFGEPSAVGVQDHRDVRVLRRRVSEPSGEIGLTRRRGQQIVAAHHLVDAGGRIVDDDGEVVRGRAVAPLQDEVVDVTGELAVDRVGDRERRDLGA